MRFSFTHSMLCTVPLQAARAAAAADSHVAGASRQRQHGAGRHLQHSLQQRPRRLAARVGHMHPACKRCGGGAEGKIVIYLVTLLSCDAFEVRVLICSGGLITAHLPPQMSQEEMEAREVKQKSRELRDEMRRGARAAGASPATMRRLGGFAVAFQHFYQLRSQ